MQTWLYDKLQGKGLSQAELARRLGITPHALNKKFRGIHPFWYHEVVQICSILGIENPLQYSWEKEKQ